MTHRMRDFLSAAFRMNAAPARHVGQRTTGSLVPYVLVLHNDHVSRFEYVARVLRRVFRYPRARAIWLAIKLHLIGRAVVWTGCLEVGELKVEQVYECGPDPRRLAAGAQPLLVDLQPV